MKPVIECEGLTFKFDQNIILNDLNFRVNEQDYIALIGENGAGKSTLLKLLIGQLPLQQGTLKLFGQSQFKDYGKIGYVPQMSVNQEFNFPATVFEIVLYHCYPSIKRFRFPNKKHRQQTLDILEKVGLLDKKDELFSNLSGGQQQKVMLAKALVNKPDLLILDEPTSGIDARSSDQFYEMLSQLNKQGLTILLVTHNVHHLAQGINRIYVLADTKIQETDHGHIHL